MRHVDAVAMFDGARFDTPAPSTWADLGCGDGTFTLALAGRLAAGSTIHAVDRDARAVESVPPIAGGVRIETYVSDFTRRWSFASVLDGILMANSLHFVESQRECLRRCAASLAPSGRFLIVEYDTDTANPWVPHPVSLVSLSRLMSEIGFRRVQKLGSRRSRYQRAAMYAALCERALTFS
jgi:trans-aconitate methyltransferase